MSFKFTNSWNFFFSCLNLSDCHNIIKAQEPTVGGGVDTSQIVAKYKRTFCSIANIIKKTS